MEFRARTNSQDMSGMKYITIYINFNLDGIALLETFNFGLLFAIKTFCY